ncbi:hypothetical protein TEA_019206 [Camellia sinensis var. sinensis]|uniref:BHLH domain-containing protein n=1 Tax=Camellia sinensis var. sinensis TaxID=542762 RepID=A0A4S4E939_CAMSN|nr:hypothetical protein TEA_019206 [Camellia sinensis var. sinensis]
MVIGVKSHHEDEEEDDEELVRRTTDGCSQKVKVDGKTTDQKANSLRSKHSETEQRRRSKINERQVKKSFRFSGLLLCLGLLGCWENPYSIDGLRFPLSSRGNCNPKILEKFLFLPHKIWKLRTRLSCVCKQRNSGGPVESFIDQSELTRNGSGQEDNIVVTPSMLTNAHNSVESVLEVAAYKVMDHPPLAANQAIPTHIPLQSSVLGDVPTQPHQASVSDSEHLASQSQSQFWQSRPCTTESAVPSYTHEQEMKFESDEANISNAYSQGLLNTLTRALQSSGVDLSQASISVQLDVGKRANTALTATLFSVKDHQNRIPGGQSRAVYGFGTRCDDCTQAPKRLRTERI